MAKSRRRQHGEGSVYQRGSDGRWVAELHLGYKADGRPDRRYFYGATASEVIAKRQKFLADRDDGFVPPKGRGPTVAEWITHWLHNIAKGEVRESTWSRCYRVVVETHLIPGLGRRLLLKDLDETRIDELYARMRSDGMAPATVLLAHRVLSRALKVAMTRRLIPRNPCQLVAPKRGDRAEVVPPDRAEAAAILRAASGRWNGARWALALTTGVRQGEALGLLWPCLDLTDLDNATMRIAWELTRLPWQHGCDDPAACGTHKRPCPTPCPDARRAGRRHVCLRPCRTPCREHEPGTCPRFCPPECTGHAASCPKRHGGLVLTEPKSAKSRRTVALPRRLAVMLAEHRVLQEAQRATAPDWTGWGHDPATCERRPRARELVCPRCRRPTRPDLLVFAQPTGRPLDPRRDWGEWRDLLAELGLPHYRLHDARHFAATTLMEEGVDVVIVQETMGHATPSFTQQVYQHVRPRVQRAAAERMDEALFGDG